MLCWISFMPGAACATASKPSFPIHAPQSFWHGGLQNGDVRVKLSADQVLDASIVVATVKIPDQKSEKMSDCQMKGRFATAEFSFYPLPFEEMGEAGLCQAIFGIPYDFAAGQHGVEFRIRWTNSQGSSQSLDLQYPLTVSKAQYRSEELKVDPSKANALPEDILPRIKVEREAVEKALATYSQEKWWSGNFMLPVKDIITSPFGSRRVYNGELKRFHSGLDLRAGIGTSIKAPAAGRVLLARDLYFTGNTILIDHGFGLITLYGHLSSMSVQEGQVLKSNQLLGKAGATGRVTGPHLHWAATLNGAKVNPIELTRVLGLMPRKSSPELKPGG